MNTVALVLAGFVALEHVGFMILEMQFWNKPLGLKVFRRTQAEQDATFSLAKNQGLYNGFLAAGLVWGLFTPTPLGQPLRMFFLGCVVLAGIVGAVTANPRILLVQGLPALAGLVATLLSMNVG